jgi:hypothetical protein
MNYPAVLASEGSQTLIVFPDLPGCQVYASINDNLLRQAQDALVDYLREELKGAEVPAPPSQLRIEGAVTGLVVPVPEDLANLLQERWQGR